MNDDLIVSGGGSTAVAVDELFVDAARLATAASLVADWIARLRSIRARLDWLGFVEPATYSDTSSPVCALRAADVGLEGAKETAERLRTSLLEAAERYGATERGVDGLWRFGAALAAPWLGFMAPGLFAGSMLAAAGQASASTVARFMGWGPTPFETWLADHRDLLSAPAFARLVRLSVDHADEFAAGVTHAPSPAPLISAVGSGIGAPENAAVLLGVMGALGAVGLTGSRLLVDGPVRVDRSATRRVDPPSGIGGLADRVPTGGSDAAQIRIERYGGNDGDGDGGDDGDPSWIVYIGGTMEFGLEAGEEPFDTTSNGHGVADDSWLDVLRLAGAESGAGERAVREAMRQAGVQPGDPLLAVGYSGGGVIAAKLAADPELNAIGAVNLGGPVASAPTRDGVGVLSIEHEEDFVPATGGVGHPSAERLTVSRSVLDEGQAYEALVPAHELIRYRTTAALVDDSDEARLAGFRALVGEVTRGTGGTRSEWIASRELTPETPDGR
jgi:hypothetical protein